MKTEPARKPRKMTTNDDWVDEKLHTIEEQIVIHEIRKKVARYTCKLFAEAEAAGKLPSDREVMARIWEEAKAKVFGPVSTK